MNKKKNQTPSKQFDELKEIAKKAYMVQQQLSLLNQAYQTFIKEKGLSEEFKQWHTDKCLDHIIDMKKN
nr:hypothetical protein [uncultured Draconibacterium sp.]